jgi:hypothetical protein
LSWLPSRNLHKNRWVGTFLAVAGSGLLLAGIWFAGDAAAFVETTARAPGIVLELQRERGVRGLPRDRPIVRFIVPGAGREVVFRSKVAVWPSPFEAGEAVEVAYDPVDPERAEIASFWTIWLPPAALGLFGLLCAGAGLLTLRWTKKS